MQSLPDDLWHRILETGTETGQLDYKDLCSLSVTCHHFDELAQDSALWANLIDRDFYRSFFEAPSKALYKEEFQNYRLRINRKYGFLWPWELLPLPRRSRFYNISFDCEPLQFEHLLNDDALVLDFLGATNDHVINDNGDDAIGQSSTSRSTHVPYVKDKLSTKLPKVPRLKVKPKSKSYISMNGPPHRAMPRKN